MAKGDVVVRFYDEEGDVLEDVAGRLVDGKFVPFTDEEALEFAEATGGAIYFL